MNKKATRKTRAKLCVCALLSGALIMQAPAVTYAEEDVPEFTFDQVVVTANRVPTKANETAANVTVVTREQIEQGNYRNLGQIISSIPGVYIANYGHPGSTSAAYINGSEQVVVMIDGRRMNLPNGIGAFGAATVNLTSFVGVENIERIEIVKGGRSALYGADAVGGVINIITKKGEKNQTTFKTAGGNWSGYDYALTNEGKDGNVSWYFTADKRHLGDYSDGKGEVHKYTCVDQDAYTFRLDQKIYNGNLSFTYENFNDENEGTEANKYDNIRQHNWDIAYTADTSANTDYQLRFYQNGNHRFSQRSDHDVRIKGFNYQINSQLDSNNILTTGVDWRKDAIQSSAYGKKDNTVKGIYLQDKWNITDQFSLIPGVRYDKNDAYGNKTTPQIGVNYKQNDRTTYYASWGKVFQSPRFDDLYWPHQENTYKGKNYIYDGNPNLKPETGWNAEIGVNHKFDNTLEGKLSYFTRKLDDAISWKNVGTDQNQHWLPSNVDQQEANGFEVQLSKQLTSEFRTFVGYNYLNLKNKTAKDNHFVKDPKVADRTWNIGITYSNDKVAADVTGTAINGRNDYKYNTFIEKSYWLWDANLNVKVNKEYTAFLTVNNIFDKYYDSTAGYPCSGRSYMLGVKATF